MRRRYHGPLSVVLYEIAATMLMRAVEAAQTSAGIHQSFFSGDPAHSGWPAGVVRHVEWGRTSRRSSARRTSRENPIDQGGSGGVGAAVPPLEQSWIVATADRNATAAAPIRITSWTGPPRSREPFSSRPVMLPSPRKRGLGLGIIFLSRPPLGSLALRPGDSLAIPTMASSVGFIRFVSSTDATQATKIPDFSSGGTGSH